MRNMREKNRKDQRLVMTAQVCVLSWVVTVWVVPSSSCARLLTRGSLFFPILAHMGAVCAQDIGAALQVYNVRIVKPDHLGRASDAAGQAGAAGSAGK